MKPHLGILLCTYNGEKWLKEQLNTILNQSLKPQHMLCIDDGSQDQTLPILQAFKEQAPFPVEIRCNTTRLGPSLNFLRGIPWVQADWILFADQDDLWDLNKLDLFQKAILQAKDQWDLILSDARLIGPEGQILGNSFWESIGFDRQNRSAFEQNQLPRLIHNPLVLGMSSAVRKTAAQEIPEPPWSLLHDEWLSWNIGLHQRIGLLEATTASYRQHPKQQTGVRRAFTWKHFWQQLKKPSAIQSSKELARHLKLASFLESQALTPPDALHQIHSQIHHLQVRCLRGWKAPWFWTFELVKGRYHLHSAGWRSFAKDLRSLVS